MGDADRVVIPLHGERVEVGRREVESGAVRLRKVIRTETVSEPVTLRREEVVIDRLPAGQAGGELPANSGQQGVALSQPFTEQTITIPLKREEPVVTTQVVPMGEVVARKQVASESTTVQQPVRTEDVQVVRSDNPADAQAAPGFPRRVDTGTAPGYVAGTGSAMSTAPITSLADLANTSDLRGLARRPVNLTRVAVADVISDHLLSVQAPDGQIFYVRTPGPTNRLRHGDLIDLRGAIRTVPERLANLGWSQEAIAALERQPIYIDATNLRPIVP